MDGTNILSTISQGLNQTLFPGHRVIRVNGWESAEKYPMPRDCETIMLDGDPSSDYIYMKVTDSNGGERFARYKLVEDPIPRFEPDKYVTTSDFVKFKEEITNGFDSLKQLISANAERSSRSGGNSKQSSKSNNELD